MRAKLTRISISIAGLLLSVTACVGSGDDSCAASAAAPDTIDAGLLGEGGRPDATVDASSDAGPIVDAGPGDSAVRPSMASVRIANWSSDAPAIDFCIAPQGSGAFEGPVLANLTATLAEAGVANVGQPALSFPGASAYAPIVPGTYDARLVAGGSVNCSVGIFMDAPLPPVAAGGALTVALIGAVHFVGTQLLSKIVAFPDDTTASSQVALRAINASPDLMLATVGTLATPAFQPLFGPIPFGSASLTPGGDASVVNGYLMAPPFDSVVFAARPAGKSVSSVVSRPLSIAGGAIVTLIVVGVGAPHLNDGGVAGAQLVECVDNAGTIGNAGSCQVVSSP